MKHAWRIGRLAGIEIKVDSSWIIIFLLFTFSLAAFYFPQAFPVSSHSFYWLLGLITSLLVFASVLFHELAHSVVARKQGEKVEDITLFILGGVARISEELKEPKKEFYLALAGPVSSFILGGLFLLLSSGLRNISHPVQIASAYLAYTNLVLGGFNLLPGFPMDGGRVLRAILWRTTGDLKKATRIASSVGQGIAFLLIFIGLVQFFRGNLGGLWLVLIGWFLHTASVQGYSQVVLKSALQDLKASDLMDRNFISVNPELPVETLVHDYILKKQERVFLVTDQDVFLGLVCLEDVKKVPRSRWPELKVSEIMTPVNKVVSIRPEANGDEVLNSLVNNEVNQLPVLEGGRVVGIITRTDLLRILQLRTDLGI
ncbi:MAG: site-2 protease family protein [Candidatus Saccharicenans sp.]|jgi:Zn-dependent protease/CBS domain-containing protein|nr:site-2 protease family protein [Candidatus Saccharicenans sp.]